MEVRSDCPPDAAAFPAAVAVIAETRHDSAEWLRTGIKARPSRVVLEARERTAHAGLELALQQDVADHAGFAGDGVEWEDADARQVGAVKIAVRPPEELVSPADREQGRAGRRRFANTVRLFDQVLCDQRLLAVLAAADVEQIMLAWIQRVSDGDGPHLELVAA